MGTEENKTLTRGIYQEVFSEGNLERTQQLVSPNCTVYSNDTLMGRGPDSFTAAFRQLRNTLPQLRWEVKSQCAEENKVWTRYTATGNSLTINGVSICTVEDGKIIQWNNWDFLANFNALSAEHSEVDVIRAQQEREVALIKEQLHRPRTGAVGWAISMGVLALILIVGALVIGLVRWGGDFNPGWVVPVTALIAAVAVVVIAALSFGNNRSDIIIQGDTMVPARPLGSTATPLPDKPSADAHAAGTAAGAAAGAAASMLATGDPKVNMPAADAHVLSAAVGAAGKSQADKPPPQTTTSGTTTASLATQEPVVITAAVTAILQVLVLTLFPVDPGTQAAIIGGLTALAGIFTRGRVKPVQTTVQTTGQPPVRAG